MTAPWPLPDGWRWMRFAESARVASALVDPSEYPDLPHIAPNHIESQTGRLLQHTTIRDDGVTSPKHLFRPGHVLYSKIRPYLAKVVVVDFEGLCSADMYPIESDVVDARYLKWWMLHPEFTKLAAGQQARTVLPKINRRALDQLPVPVPPKDEQLRIVDILEDHLSRLDAAKTYLDGAAARTGTLLESALRNSPELTDCATAPLSTLLAAPLTNGRSVPTRAGGFPVLRLTALQGDRVDLCESKPGAWTAAEAQRFLARRGDVFVSRGNGSLALVGRAAALHEEPTPVAFPDTMIRVRPDTAQLASDYLVTVWNSRSVRRQIERVARTTAGIYKVNQGDLSGIQVPLPSITDQGAVLARVAELRESVRAVDQALGLARQRSAGLRQALLASAFSGALTADSANQEHEVEFAHA